MPRTGGKFDLSSYDDIFSTQEERDNTKAQPEASEVIQKLKLSDLVPFKNHPFKVKDDEDMDKTVDSIRQFGVLNPVIVRPQENGTYEIVSGHRRCHASELAGLEEIPAIVRNLDDDAATILMVDSNLQRETILPSERAWAFKMKADAMKHRGERSDLTSVQVAPKWTTQVLGEEAGMSKDNVKRYIRLTNLKPELLDMVDDKQIAFNPAVELSYLKPEEQIVSACVADRQKRKERKFPASTGKWPLCLKNAWKRRNGSPPARKSTAFPSGMRPGNGN